MIQLSWLYAVQFTFSKPFSFYLYPCFSASPGGILDRAVDAEEAQHKDFLRLVNDLFGYILQTWLWCSVCETLLCQIV